MVIPFYEKCPCGSTIFDDVHYFVTRTIKDVEKAVPLNFVHALGFASLAGFLFIFASRMLHGLGTYYLALAMMGALIFVAFNFHTFHTTARRRFAITILSLVYIASSLMSHHHLIVKDRITVLGNSIRPALDYLESNYLNEKRSLSMHIALGNRSDWKITNAFKLEYPHALVDFHSFTDQDYKKRACTHFPNDPYVNCSFKPVASAGDLVLFDPKYLKRDDAMKRIWQELNEEHTVTAVYDGKGYHLYRVE
jgi:hypothetical protein